MAICYVGLGGNTGDVQDAFRESLRRLQSLGLKVMSLSGLYRTRAVGSQAGPAFLNAAVELQTTLEPEPVLDLLQDVERALGRTREVHWGPRTIDLDLLMFDSRIVHAARLTLPHPACWYRRFVLDPLAEIAGQRPHPERRLTVSELRDRLRERPLRVALLGGDALLREELTFEVTHRFGAQVEIAKDSKAEAVLIFCFPDADDEPVSLVSRVPVENGAGAVASVLDVIQAAVDTPVRIAAPGEWYPSID